MRKQTQFNGLWQHTATGVIRFADTEHGVLWERTLEASREVWRQLDVSKSHLRGYLAALSEAGWQMVSSNRDAAREPDAYEAWHGDMFPHGVPLRVSEYACDVKHAAMSACESDAAAGWIVDTRGAVHALTPEEREMIRLTMAMDAMNDSWELDAGGDMEPDMGEPDPEPRSVESVPTLPAECSAETQEIPEVPPQVNDRARVLKVSEHVIPTGQKVAGGEMFPDVSYRSVHAFTVAVLDAAGNVVKRKKVAYAFRHNGMVHVVRRDRYELAGRDVTVEAEIAEFAAKLQKAA